MASMGTHLVWIDAETTGTVAHKGSLLEIACIITDSNFNVLTEEPFHAVIGYDDEAAQHCYLSANEYVRDMHEKTGLWDRIRDGEPLESVEANLLAFIKEHVPEPGLAHIAGNSTRLDLNFVEEHLPAVGEHLHYRMLDVSTLALLVGWQFGVTVEKGSDHTALTDITESIAQLHVLWGPIVQRMQGHTELFATATPLAVANRASEAISDAPQAALAVA